MNRDTQKKLLETVSRNYEEIAEGFSETRGKPLWREVSHLVEEIEPDATVLDVGCGNGRLLQVFKDKRIKYLGVEPSVGLLEEARREFPDQKFTAGNILNLGEIPEHNFDYVISVAVIHHLPGEDLRIQALKQLKNKVKEDGTIIITAWNLWTKPKYRKLIFKFFLLKLFGKNNMDFGDILFDWRKDKDKFLSQRYYHAFTRSELKKIVKKAGLKVTEYKKDEYNYYLVLKK